LRKLLPTGKESGWLHTIVANALKAFRQNVEQKSADELVCFQVHDLDPTVVAIILPISVPDSSR
jgi:hypothetical protein